MTYRDPSMIDHMHYEQTLWYTRRIVELEANVEEATKRAQRAEGEHGELGRLADDLADVVRRLARGETVEVTSEDRYSNLPLERWRERRRSRSLWYRTEPVDPFEGEPWP